METIELPHEEYTTLEEINRIMNELVEKKSRNEVIPIRKDSHRIMIAEPAINGIWILLTDEKRRIKKIVLC